MPGANSRVVRLFDDCHAMTDHDYENCPPNVVLYAHGFDGNNDEVHCDALWDCRDCVQRVVATHRSVVVEVCILERNLSVHNGHPVSHYSV